MDKSFTERIKAWIIHRLGGITETEIPIKTKVQFRYESVKPQRLSAAYVQILYPTMTEEDVKAYTKATKETLLEKLISGIDREGFIRYTTDEVKPPTDTDVEQKVIRRTIRADLWVVKPVDP